MEIRNKNQILKMILYYIAFIGLGLTSGVLGPSLLRLADNAGTTIGQISSIFFFRSLGYMIGAVIGGRGYDRLPGHLIMVVTLVFIAISLAITPVINVLWVLIAVMFLLGMAQGALDVGGATLLVWVYGSKVGPFINGLHLFFGFGAFLAPIMIAQSTLVQNNLNLAYWGMAAFMLIPAIGLAMFKSPDRVTNSNISEPSMGSNSFILLGMLFAFFLFYGGVESGFTGWIFTYAITSNLLNEVASAYATSFFWGAFTLGRLVSIPIAIKLRPHLVLAIDLLGFFISILIMLLWQGSVTAFWISIAGTGFFSASIFPTIITFSENRMRLTGKTTSLFFVGAGIGGMFFPWLIGQYYASVGPRMVPMTIAASAALLLLLFVVLVKKYPGKAKESEA